MDQIRPVQSPATPPARDLAAACRELDARGAKYVVVQGVAVVPQGFSRPAEQMDLQAQCSALNQQAVMPPPETLAGKSFREILDATRP